MQMGWTKEKFTADPGNGLYVNRFKHLVDHLCVCPGDASIFLLSSCVMICRKVGTLYSY